MKRLVAILSAFALCLPVFAQNEPSTFESDETQQVSRSLSLEQCKSLAVQNNAKIRNAELDIEAAELTKKGVFTKYFPQVAPAAAAGCHEPSCIGEGPRQVLWKMV